MDRRKITRHIVLTTVLVSGLCIAALLSSVGVTMAATAPVLSSTSVPMQGTGVSTAKETTATLYANISSDGGAAISERGFVWSTTDTTPTLGEVGVNVTKIVASGTATGGFSVNATGLPSASHIYFQGYATNSAGTGHSGVQSFYTELPAAAAPTIDTPGYFQFTVHFAIPDSNTYGTDSGVVVVVQQGDANHTDISKPPYDGIEYTALSGTSSLGNTDATDPTCPTWCAGVVATEPSVSGGNPSGSVVVTGLKEGYTYYAAVFTYKGSGTAGPMGINYNQTINSSSLATTTIPVANASHNELYVAGTYDSTAGTWTPGTMTSDLCTTCHSTHHTSQLLYRGLDQYQKCFSCHKTGGSAEAKSDIALHNGGSIDCGSCHSLHSFRTEELYSKNHSGTWDFNLNYVRTNMSKYYGTALDNTVFQSKPADYAYTVSDDDPDRPGFYNGVCQTCHTDDAKTLYHQQNSTTGHNVGMDCLSCHPHKTTDNSNAFFPTGGHSDTDFAWAGDCDYCHSATPGSPTEAVVSVIHNNDCLICHTTASGGTGTARTAAQVDPTNGVDGNPSLASLGTGAPHTDTCLTCHPSATYSKPFIHHDSPSNFAATGDCNPCHADPRGGANGNLQIKQMSCVKCHVGFSGADLVIYSITYAKEGSAAATGDDSGNTYTPITSPTFSADHTIPNNSVGILDYGACFNCHGNTGNHDPAYAAAPQPLPYHALPDPGAYNSDPLINTIGGNGYQDNLGNNGGARFRGGKNWGQATQGGNAYHPIGKGRLNIGYAQHGLIDHTTQGLSYEYHNTGADTTYQNMPAGITWGKVVIPATGSTYFIPHFDPTCTSTNGGCDDISNVSASKDSSKGNTLGFTVGATSSTGAIMHVIYGGRDLCSFASGSSCSFNWSAIGLDQWNAGATALIWIASEDGGAASIMAPTIR